MKLNGVLDYHKEVCILLGISHILLLCSQQKNGTGSYLELGVLEIAANFV